MQEYYDVIIVGTGAAGLFCALNIDTAYSILVITKDSLENSNSYLAQGGIAALKSTEDYTAYFEDTLKAGRYQNNVMAVDIMIRSSNEIIQDLVHLGIEFDKAGSSFSFTREGAHSTSRILHHKDITGKEITSKLLRQAQLRPNITLKPFHTLIDLMTDNNSCNGAVISSESSLQSVYASIVVLATGGIGGLFKNSTNFPHLTGDGLAIALGHGIAVQDVHSIQIHPTALYTTGTERRFLISEAVRGEGAHLLNLKKERFVDELLPRDRVSMAIENQMKQSNSPYVYLSAIHLGTRKIHQKFPHIYKRCLEEGYDMTKDLIPVTPAQHYYMGGIKVNMEGETSMKYLYAIGETSCNGVHGANRLASNSLLESLVFAKRAAVKLANTLKSDSPALPIQASVQKYNLKTLKEDYHIALLQEIKRKDEKFYERWCTKMYQCG